MIRDSLAELVHANHVDVLKKVCSRVFFFRWPYPAGGGAMWTWNALPRANKLTDIDNNW